jgi:transposase
MSERWTIQMSRKEREALVVLERVKRGEMKLAGAAEVMGISYRQCGRRFRRYEAEGALGLVHRLRGTVSNRAIATEVCAEILGLYRGRYEGFGPVLFTEKLHSEHKIKVDHETVRRLLTREGLWTPQRKRKKRHAVWRERRSRFGELVQMDGSHHRWFEERGEKSCLMVMIDDATGVRMSYMAKEETTEAAMRLLWMWVERYGVPGALYTDKKNVYVPAEKDRENARLEGRELVTQFGRSCKRLGIEIVRAHSPQAKGRVERSNGVYQDRLVKELRLKALNNIEPANELLAGGGFDDDLNRRFSVEPNDADDAHRPLAEDTDLAEIFSIEHERTLSANWTLSFENRVYQLEPDSANYSPTKRKATVRKYLDGSLHFFYRGAEVESTEINPVKPPTPVKPLTRRKMSLAARGQAHLPSQNHPWRTPWSTKQIMKLQQSKIGHF